MIAAIQETIHITREHSSLAVALLIAQLVLSLLPILLVAVAMLFLHRARQTQQSLYLLLLSIAWFVMALGARMVPIALPLLSVGSNIHVAFGLMLGVAIAEQILFILFAVALIGFCRNLFYGVFK